MKRALPHYRLRKEITLVMVLKIMALMLLWAFLLPPSSDKNMTPRQLAQHFKLATP